MVSAACRDPINRGNGFFLLFPGGHVPAKTEAKGGLHDRTRSSDLAITDGELRGLRRYLHERISGEIQAFWRDLGIERQRMEQHEQELARRRQEIESRHAAALLKKRQKLPKIDWTHPPDFEGEAVRKVHQQNVAQLESQFSPKAFLDRLTPHLFVFASLVVTFERIVIPDLPTSELQAYCERVVRTIVRMIMPSTYTQC